MEGKKTPHFDGVQLFLTALVKSLGITLGPALLLEKQVITTLKNAFF